MNKSITRLKNLFSAESSRKNLHLPIIKFYTNFLRVHLFRDRFITKMLRRGLFVSINLETFAHCNRECDFCFNNKRFEQREKGQMSFELWKKIIDELAELDFKGRISPHFYGEPL